MRVQAVAHVLRQDMVELRGLEPLTFSLRTLFLPGKRRSASIQDGARDAWWPPTTLLGSTQGAHAALANRVLAEAQNGPLSARPVLLSALCSLERSLSPPRLSIAACE